MRIRKLEKGDIGVLTELRIAFLLDESTPEALGNMDVLCGQLRDYFLKGFDSDSFAAFVAEDEGGIHSVAFLGITDKPPRAAGEPGQSGTVYNVYTYPDSRRKGYAKKVMEAILEEAKERRLKNVELLASRYGKPLYEQLGFGIPGHTYMRIRVENL